jgi:D-glycerate 3-kinase
MDTEELLEFIMHYERLTRAQLEEMPQRADLVMQLDDNHQVRSVRIGSSSLARE